MPNVMKELKSEISRLARKEIKGELATTRKSIVAQRGLIAGLRRQNDAMQKELNGLKKALPATGKAVLAKTEPTGRFWITGKGVKNLRKRLGLTQTLFGKLAGVSGQSVVKWEATKGKIGLRKSTAGKLQEIRGLKKRDVAGKMGLGKAKSARGDKAKRKAGATKKIKRFDLLKDLGKPVAGKVEPKATANSNANPNAKKT